MKYDFMHTFYWKIDKTELYGLCVYTYGNSITKKSKGIGIMLTLGGRMGL